MRVLPLISLLLLSMVAQATVYKWVDKEGKVHYSDEPQPNAEVVTLKEKTLNQLTSPALATDSANAPVIEEIKYQVVITSPEEEATLRDNNGDFEVSATVFPELKSQYLMRLSLDGQLVAPPQASNVFKLTGIDRGEHIIVIDAMTQNGKVLASSPPRKIFLHQAAKR